MIRHECSKCESICGLSFNRPYPPQDWIEGDPASPIWIIGLNPRTLDSEADNRRFHDRDLSATRNGFAEHVKAVRYFKIFERISTKIHKGLGHYVAHTDLVKCDSKSWPPNRRDQPTLRQKDIDSVVKNCGSYLEIQIKAYRPKLLICNGADVCRYIRQIVKPSTGTEADTPLNASTYVGSVSNHSITVVQTGFAGRLDNFSLRRLGIDIERAAESLKISGFTNA